MSFSVVMVLEEKKSKKWDRKVSVLWLYEKNYVTIFFPWCSFLEWMRKSVVWPENNAILFILSCHSFFGVGWQFFSFKLVYNHCVFCPNEFFLFERHICRFGDVVCFLIAFLIILWRFSGVVSRKPKLTSSSSLVMQFKDLPHRRSNAWISQFAFSLYRLNE